MSCFLLIICFKKHYKNINNYYVLLVIVINICYTHTVNILYLFNPGHGLPGNKAGKAMLNTINGKIVISGNNNCTICIDTICNEISCNAPGNIYPVKKLSLNQSHTVKINKTSISTCNIEFLAYALKTSPAIFNAVHGYIYGVLDIETAQKEEVTRPAFYATFNDDLNAFINFFRACSHETRQTIIYDHICFNHDAKMSGIISISTFVGANNYCLARCNNCDNAICKYCYAASLTKQRDGLKNKLRRIHAILTTIELTIDDIPTIDVTMFPYFRFESFGDLNNVIQIKNYNLITRVNPGVNFTLWTKNPGIIQNAIDDGLVLSDNLVVGLSSLYLNTPEIKKAQRYSFIRFLFTVYDDEYIKEHDIKINCGAKHCISCGICYKYLHEFKHGLQLINERKK